jgi:hypothetical protein
MYLLSGPGGNKFESLQLGFGGHARLAPFQVFGQTQTQAANWRTTAKIQSTYSSTASIVALQLFLETKRGGEEGGHLAM